MTANLYILIISIALAIFTYNYFNKRAATSPPRTVLQNVLKVVKYYFVASAYYIIITLGYSFAVVGITQVSNTTIQKPAENDIAVLADFRGYTQEWNQTVGKIVSGYLDPSVSAEDWVAVTNINLPELRGIIIKMNMGTVMLEDKDTRNMYSKLVGNYQEKLDGFTKLHFASAQGNTEGVKEAWIEIQKAGKNGQEIALEYLAKVKNQVDPEILRKMMKESADASAKALQPNLN